MESSFKKIVQKKTYDILSHKYGLILIIVGTFALGISAFHFGEAVVDWSREKYASVFNSFSDNIAGRSFRKRLCLPVPIDVVYTWVNGTDESLVWELRQVKRDMELELNITREEKCTFSNCVPAGLAVLDPMTPRSLTLNQFTDLFPSFSEASGIYDLHSDGDDKLNVTVVAFNNATHVKGVVGKRLSILGRNITVSQGFYTSDSSVQGGIVLKDTILMSGFPHTYKTEELTQKIPHPVNKVELVSDKGIAVLQVTKKEDFDSLVNLKNFSIEGKEPTFSAAKLVWDLRDFSRDEDIAASRYEDNEELRYSLRSVEKYAPWVRHVYIVTNGQLPYWLDLENPRVSVVTHEEIFPNKSHLPTYSSPAIESHLHRIPGLSDKFIYLNDDVMFGSEVWPDDFYSQSQGQKVYLTWPVPNCNEGCPSTWIKDGYCDKACNTSECDWDAGDCDGDSGRLQLGAGYQGGFGDAGLHAQAYCNTGCANNWIADKYCDTACNVKKCGFDAGDCGTKSYEQLYELRLTFDEIHYHLPPGEFVAYFNLTDIVKEDGKITEAIYNDSKVIRQVAVGNKYKVMTLVLHQDKNDTTLDFHLVGHQGSDQGFKFNFSVSVNTNSTMRLLYEKEVKKKLLNTTGSSEVEEMDDIVIIPHVPLQLQNPKPVTDVTTPPDVDVPLDFNRNMTDLILPWVIREELDKLNRDYAEGDLTRKGYDIQWKLLYKRYITIKDDPSYEKETLKPIVPIEEIQNTTRSSVDPEVKSEGSKVRGHNETSDHGPMRKLLAVLPSEWSDINNINVKLDEEYPFVEGKERNIRILDTKRVAIEETLPEDFLERVQVGEKEVGGLPWERNDNITELQKLREEIVRARQFDTPSPHGRRLLDTFGDSLRHVNKLYNKAFGFTARKVPAHMPHMIDRHIMDDLQTQFPNEWDVTSSHKVRHSKDMQYAFSYFYYLMGITQEVTVEQVFADMDTDHSRALSDRELRTFAARLYDLPLYLETLQGLEQIFINCSQHLADTEQRELPPPLEEVYYDKAMPQVTKKLFLNCGGIHKLIKDKFQPKSKYKYTIVDDSDVTFYMIRTNVSSVVGQLDNVRKHTKKFICLNDNIEHGSQEAKTVKAVLQDFYESLYPIQSQFELPREYRNRFLHTKELREWRRYRDWLKFWTHLALVVLVLFTIVSFFGDKIEAAHRRLTRKKDKVEDIKSTNESEASAIQPKERPLLPV